MDNYTNHTQQAFWVSLGSMFSFGFTLVSSMILSRYFPKEDYGTYKQVLYVYNTLLVVFTLGLPKAFSYYLPRVSINHAKSLIRKITNFFFILGGIFSLLLFVFSSKIALVLKNPDLVLAIKVFSPVPFLMLPTMGLEGILATYQHAKFIAIYTVLSRVFMLICVALPVILFSGDYIQAIAGFVVASFITFLIALYLKYLPVRHAGNEKTQITYNEILSFSLPLMYASIWGIIITSADQFFISRYFGSAVFADFANGSLELPFVAMVVGATSTILSPYFSRQIHEEADPKKIILPLWKSVFEKTTKIIYPLILYSWFFADIVMIVLYGDKYENSSIYFRIKVIENLFTIVAFAPLIIALGETKFYSKVFMYSSILLIASEYISVLLFNSPYVITVVSVIFKIGRIFIFLIFISNFFGIRFLELFPLKLIAKIFIPSILQLIIIRYLLLDLFLIKGLLLLCLAFITYALVFLVWCHFIKVDYITILKPLFKSQK